MGANKGKRTYEVDPSKSPAAIDLFDDGKLVSRGIYALEKDTLTLCLGMTIVGYDSPLPGTKPASVEADERPTSFDPLQGVLLVMKRAK